MRLAKRCAISFFVLVIFLSPFVFFRVEASSSGDLRGVQWGNFKWLDPFRVFPQKPSVRQGVSDKDLFEEMLKKIELSKAKSVKIILSTYATEEYPEFWRDAQRQVINGIHQRFPDIAFIFLLDPLYYLDGDPAVTLVKAPLMAKDFSAVINQITEDVQDQNGSPPIWIIIGNEPNFPEEGFSGNPAYFNAWFKAVVWNFWNVYPIWSKYNGEPHGIFYPGLAFNFDPMGWYQAESTKEILRHWTNGVSLHSYWQTGHEKDPAQGELYKTLWRDAIAPVNPNLSIIIDEWGNYSLDDMDSVKAHEYVRWLNELMKQKDVPIIASNGFILDGTDEWRTFLWTEGTAKEIGSMNVS